jgi:hypothetical protein
VDPARCAADAWLAEHPPLIEWSLDIPPYEVDPAHPLVTAMLDASAAVGEPSRISGLDSWYDAASFTRFGGTPCDRLGPARHRLGAHDRRVRPRRRPGALRTGAGNRRDPLL